MKAGAEMALVLGIAALGAAGTWKISGPPNRAVPCDPATISEGEICLSTLDAEWPEGTFLWVDARLPEEWKANGLPGSVPITLTGATSFEQQVEAALEPISQHTRAVVYCGSASCTLSKDVASRLRDLGLLQDVRSLNGGWEALQQAGRIKGSSPSN